ncbi:MAG TPA: TatD family hydrolase [Candidatus Acidoferrales bacterium]|nr:TatD family hydrolase [Candidatus Acidoferrales bacterium]
MIPIFYDTHAHLDYDDYQADFTEVLARAQDAGITKIVSIATDLKSSRRALELAEKHRMIYAAIGWHPSNAHEAPADIRPELRELARHPKAVAIGECGLDYYRLPSTQGGTAADDAAYKRKQAEVFQQQLDVAIETGLHCVIHQRSSFEDLFAQIRPFARQTQGVFHCFGESLERLRMVLDLGWLVSFTGIVTFKNGENIRAAAAAAPMGKFMLETDCPYLAPVPFRGQRCEPAYVKEISETVARVKNCSPDDLSAATCKTAQALFPKLG